MFTPEIRAMVVPYRESSALSLLVTGVGTDHEHPSVAADDLALLTHWLDRRSYLHADSPQISRKFSVESSARLWRPLQSPLPRRRGTRSVKWSRCRRTGQY